MAFFCMAIIRMTSGTWSGTHAGVGWLGGRSLVLGGTVAIWAGHVEDDLSGLGVRLFGDGGEGAEELVGDVGEDGGTAGGDFVLREEEEQAGEEVVDLGGGGEVVEVDGEGGGDFRRVGLVCGRGAWAGQKFGLALVAVRRQRRPLGKRWVQRAELLMKRELAVCWDIKVFLYKWDFGNNRGQRRSC